MRKVIMYNMPACLILGREVDEETHLRVVSETDTWREAAEPDRSQEPPQVFVSPD